MLSMLRVLFVGIALLFPSLSFAVEQVQGLNPNPGALRFFRHIPSVATRPMPLVVVLHGCTQTAQYATDTGWVALADALGVALVIPEQDSANNQNRCFNWFESGDIARASGEAASIAAMVAHVVAAEQIDTSRVFVTGLSAGGAMTAVMLATYPELFAAGAVVAGVPYRCGVGLNDALSCMNNGRTLAASAWGDLVRGAGTHTGPWPRVAVWHGTSDTTVRPANADNLVVQWGNVLGLPAQEDSSEVNGRDTVRTWRSGNTVMMEDHRISMMGHGTPVDPGPGAEQCGTATAYVLDVNVCSARAMARFFGLLGPQVMVDAGTPPPDAGTPPVDAGNVVVMDAGVTPVDGTVETFSSSEGPDLSGWTINSFSPDDTDHTGGVSRSLRATAVSGVMCNTAPATALLSRTFVVPANATLTYQRQLNLDAAVNINSTASFRVKVNGTVVDESVATFTTITEATWTTRAINMAAYGGQTVTLSFEAGAVSTVCIAVTADVLLDDIVLAAPGGPVDAGTPAPDAAVTAPDASITSDAAVSSPDAAVALDAAVARDAALTPDAAVARDGAVTTPDAGSTTQTDAGTTVADAGTGGDNPTCNCEQSPAEQPWGAAFLLLGMWSALRGRFRRHP